MPVRRMKKSNTFTILEGEAWWGGCAFDGPEMPFTAQSGFFRAIDPNSTGNQAMPLLISSRGRFLWCEGSFDLTVKDGALTLAYQHAAPVLREGFGTLRGAYLAAAREFFPPSGQTPPAEFFTAPQFNSWIEFTYYQSQEGLLSYAKAIRDNGYPCGLLMIDCGWQEYYGRWRFNRERFPDPKTLMDALHGMGFKVMLWTCPFVSADSLEYRYLRDRGLLVRDADGEPSRKKWWDGYSAVLDLSNPEAEAWYLAQNQALIDEYGVDGFKLDAGDAYFYSDDDVTCGHVTANQQSELWAKLGLHYPYNEYRACYGCAGLPLVQRLCDKLHTWEGNGLSALVDSAVADGLIGHPFVCPDMIGGGDYLNFVPAEGRLDQVDQELVVRYAQASALMPMMQFSAAPWRILDEEHNRLCLEAAELHTRYADLILRLAENAAKTGEPIIRSMEYSYPGEVPLTVKGQFLLGDELLVAPVVKKGAVEQEVWLPGGSWRYATGEVYDGGRAVTVPAPLACLPYFIKEH